LREKLKIKINKDVEFNKIIKEIIEKSKVQNMRDYRQHFNISCYEHCYLVSYYCYIICKKLNLDYMSATRAGMLHDLFLYDWRKNDKSRKGIHAFTHGKTAYKNACEIFDLNDKEKDMILKHMWPVTIILPKYKETFILTFVDKYCAVYEMIESLFGEKITFKKCMKYAYLLLCIIIFKKTY